MGSVTLHACWSTLGRIDSSILEAWRRAAPTLFPTHADDHEPVRQRLADDLSNLEQTGWDTSVWIARRAKPRVRVSRIAGRIDDTLWIGIKQDRGGVAVHDLLAATKAMLAQAPGGVAIVHSLTRAEAEAELAEREDLLLLSRRTRETVLSLPPLSRLDGRLPSLYWWMWFGPGVMPQLATALAAAPVASVEPWAGGTAIQLTEQPVDDVGWPAFRATREACRQRLAETRPLA